MASKPPETADIILATLNARYIHSAFGLRYLQANLGPLQSSSRLLEFTIKQDALDIAEAILATQPRIVGLGVYIWNAAETLALVRLLRSLQPDLVVVLGGPEISYEYSEQPLFALADHIVTGEGEVAFARLCADLLAGERPPKVIAGPLPATAELALPYRLYRDEDIANRVLYVEASRGCPFRCEFCLSALDKKVRAFPLEAFLAEMEVLIERGARQFKFVDRTFNLSVSTSAAILEFFLGHIELGIFVHFEMVPDRFPKALRSLIERFPAGSIQLEVGIQTLDDEVAARIDRHQRSAKVIDNLRYLVQETGVHLHTDLIVGLPGEDLASFGRGFDRLLATGVQEIQVGILKRLRGAPIARHTETYRMLYSPLPPYELLGHRDLERAEMARMRRFARYWDSFANSGRFARTLALLLEVGSAFERFAAFSEWLHERFGQSHGLSLMLRLDAMFEYLVAVCDRPPEAVAQALYADHRRVVGKDHVPEVLRPFVDHVSMQTTDGLNHIPARQRRHLLEN